ncbi:hypothetical protein [Paenibacillus elgii]|uniref:hypothetical protein n=1 Tax=Paenibacillus elgii TaxID=189691 RepID=UPI0013D3114D|nr:hypothetical protein [Paenibacillus elgii]
MYIGNLDSTISLLSEYEKLKTPSYMLDYINYRKSGLSLNHIIGCPLNCAYCVRHFWGNFDDKTPHMICTDEEAITSLLNHQYFIPDVTPIQLFNKATDPFLPSVKAHTFYILNSLDKKGLKNIVTVITRYKVDEEDMKILESLENIKLVLFFTYSGITESRIEPIAPFDITLNSIRIASKMRKKTKIVLYWRPIVIGWNDAEETMKKVLDVGSLCDGIVFTGYYHKEKNSKYIESLSVNTPYSGESFQRRKVLPQELDEKVVRLHRELKVETPLFRKTSCGASFVHNLPDYNGHWGINELCDICPSEQKKLCSSTHKKPSYSEMYDLLNKLNYKTHFIIDNGHIWTKGLGEEKRYHLQHILGFQVWDINLPHYEHQHGRGEIGFQQNQLEIENYLKMKKKFDEHSLQI